MSAALRAFTDATLRPRSEARLVAMVRAGEDPAFAEIVRRYRPALVSYASGFVSADRAAEVVEDGFWRAHVIVSSTRGELALAPWLFTVVHNGAVNASRGVQPALPVHSYDDGPMAEQAVLAVTGEVRSLVEALRSLPPAQREKLVAADFERLEHRPGRRRAAALALVAAVPIFIGRAWARTGGRLGPVRRRLRDRFAPAESDGVRGRPLAALAQATQGRGRRVSATLALASIAAAVALVISGETGAGDSAATAEQPGTGAGAIAKAADDTRKPSKSAGETAREAAAGSPRRRADRHGAVDGSSTDRGERRAGASVRGSRGADPSAPGGADSTGTGAGAGGGGQDASGGGPGGGGSAPAGGGSSGGGSAGGGGTDGPVTGGPGSGGSNGGGGAASPAGGGGEAAGPPAGGASGGGPPQGDPPAGGTPPPDPAPSLTAPPPPPPPSDEDDGDDDEDEDDD